MTERAAATAYLVELWVDRHPEYEHGFQQAGDDSHVLHINAHRTASLGGIRSSLRGIRSSLRGGVGGSLGCLTARFLETQHSR